MGTFGADVIGCEEMVDMWFPDMKNENFITERLFAVMQHSYDNTNMDAY